MTFECPHCGEELPDYAAFCARCGKPVRTRSGRDFHPEIAGMAAGVGIAGETGVFVSNSPGSAPTVPGALAGPQTAAPGVPGATAGPQTAAPGVPGTSAGAQSGTFASHGATTASSVGKTVAQGVLPKALGIVSTKVVAIILVTAVVVGGGTAGVVLASKYIGPSSPSSSASAASVGSSQASSATVTITPASKALHNTYTLSAVTGTPDASKQQVQARVPSATTQTYTTTVPANGQGTIPATHATGTLLILNNSQSPVTFSAGTIFPNTDGVGPMVSIAIDATITIDYGSPVVVAAHVVQAGSGGNFDATSNNFVSTDSSGCPSSPCVQAFNNSAFSGGQDAQSYTTVTQSDIDNAANALESQNTPDPMQVLQGQIQPNEQWAGSPQCTPKVTSNHKAGDRATQVTVNVTFTCTGEVYDHDGAETLATKLLMQQGATDPGSGYAPVGQIKTIVTNATVGNQNTVALTVSAEGIWVYQFSTDQEQVLARMIAGKNKREAQQILSNQTGVVQVTIQLSGRGGQVLPSNPAKISFVVQTVPGA